MQLPNKKVLITGGSSGIGKAIINELSIRGIKDFAVVGRKIEGLTLLKTELNHINITTIQADISNLEDLDRIKAWVEHNWGSVDILINSAAVVSAGLLTELSDEDIISQININLTGLILLTKRMIPLLRKSKQAAIINLSSGYGYIAMPFYSVYAASKAAVRHFSEAMRRELHQDAIHVMAVYPRATNTPMMQSAEVENMEAPEVVAVAAVEGLLHERINVIMGGQDMEQQIRLNFLEPTAMDQVAINNYESLRKRTSHHRAM